MRPIELEEFETWPEYRRRCVARYGCEGETFKRWWDAFQNEEAYDILECLEHNEACALAGHNPSNFYLAWQKLQEDQGELRILKQRRLNAIQYAQEYAPDIINKPALNQELLNAVFPIGPKFEVKPYPFGAAVTKSSLQPDGSRKIEVTKIDDREDDALDRLRDMENSRRVANLNATMGGVAGIKVENGMPEYIDIAKQPDPEYHPVEIKQFPGRRVPQKNMPFVRAILREMKLEGYTAEHSVEQMIIKHGRQTVESLLFDNIHSLFYFAMFKGIAGRDKQTIDLMNKTWPPSPQLKLESPEPESKKIANIDQYFAKKKNHQANKKRIEKRELDRKNVTKDYKRDAYHPHKKHPFRIVWGYLATVASISSVIWSICEHYEIENLAQFIMDWIAK